MSTDRKRLLWQKFFFFFFLLSFFFSFLLLRSRRKKEKRDDQPVPSFVPPFNFLDTFKRRSVSSRSRWLSRVSFYIEKCIFIFFSLTFPFFFVLVESFDISTRTTWRRRCVCSCLIRRFDRMYTTLPYCRLTSSVAVILLPSTAPFFAPLSFWNLEGHQQKETIEDVLSCSSSTQEIQVQS